MKFPKLNSPAVLSPMAGVTDVAFRALTKQYGAGLTCTEFVSSLALIKGSQKTLDMIQIDPSEKPVAVQLFGHNSNDVVNAAKIVEESFDIIDVNCGCPAWKVIKTGAGSALLKNPEAIGAFIKQLTAAIKKPVTVKIRIGINEKTINAVQVAKIVEKAGASAVAIHGRTQEQGYRGNADWKVIKEVKEQVNIPVIGNGDVTSPEVFAQRLEESGVDAIMIARGAMGNPYIFKQINDFLKHGQYKEKKAQEQFSEYMQIAQRYRIVFALVKNHALQFTKGVEGGARMREQISQCKNIDELNQLLSKAS